MLDSVGLVALICNGIIHNNVFTAALLPGCPNWIPENLRITFKVRIYYTWPGCAPEVISHGLCVIAGPAAVAGAIGIAIGKTKKVLWKRPVGCQARKLAGAHSQV